MTNDTVIEAAIEYVKELFAGNSDAGVLKRMTIMVRLDTGMK